MFVVKVHNEVLWKYKGNREDITTWLDRHCPNQYNERFSGMVPYREFHFPDHNYALMFVLSWEGILSEQ